MSEHMPVFVPTAVAPEALSRFGNNDHNQTHRSAVRALRDHGILVLPKSGVREITQTLNNLSNTQNTLWRELIKELKTKGRHDTRKQASSTKKLLDSAMSAADPAIEIRLGLIDSELEPAYKSHTQSSADANGRIELVRLPDVSISSAIKNAESSEWFAEGTDRELVAKAFLIPQAERSKNVRIFDPYLFHDVLGASGGEERSHAEWLVSTLASSMSRDSELELIADAPRATRRDGKGRELLDDNGRAIPLNDDGIREILRSKIGKWIRNPHTAPTIKLCLVRGAKKRFQDRFIDFSASTTFDVNHDFDRLGQSDIWQRLKFTRITKEAEIEELRAVANGYLSSRPIEITLPDGRAKPRNNSDPNVPKSRRPVAPRYRE